MAEETEFLCCFWYLPPINSTRNIDGNEFCDTLLIQIHMYCKDTVLFLCGDPASGALKRNFWEEFTRKRNFFDESVQRVKRKYWSKKRQELADICQGDSREFWKSIGQIGIRDERNKRIPMEVTDIDGSISRDLHDILNKWKTDFRQLLNPKPSANQKQYKR